jgi:hypothetical protein
MRDIFETLAKYSTLLIIFKLVVHFIIESIRRDGVETPELRGSGRGGTFLLPIPRHSNRKFDYWIVLANIAYFLGIVLVLIYIIVRNHSTANTLN